MKFNEKVEEILEGRKNDNVPGFFVDQIIITKLGKENGIKQSNFKNEWDNPISPTLVTMVKDGMIKVYNKQDELFRA